MNKEIKRWVEYWMPGSFTAESWTKEIDHLDPQKIEWPESAYMFRLFEREDMVDGETRYTGQPKQIGATYYHPDSKIETLAEVKLNPNKGQCLVTNMECNKWDAVIWSRWGNWPQPYREEETVVLSANDKSSDNAAAKNL